MPKIRFNGGLVGSYNTTDTISASGVWTLQEYDREIKTSTWPINKTNQDPDFSDTIFLIHGDNLGNANNSILKDLSPNALEVTSNGQNFFVGGFGPTNSGGWSTSFQGGALNGGADETIYWACGDLAKLDSNNTPFTLECWVKPTKQLSGTGIFCADHSSQDITYALCGVTALSSSSSGSFLNFGFYNATTGIWYGTSNAVTSLSLNVWQHVAASYNGTTLNLYLNGKIIGTYTGGWMANAPNAGLVYIGRRWDTAGTPFFQGSISNLRFVSGKGLYPNEFTPPTSPLKVVANTILLTCQDNYIKDNSPFDTPLRYRYYPHTVPDSPFSPSDVYSNTNSGSIFFERRGVTKYFSVSNNVNLQLATSNTPFTWECWCYPTNHDTGSGLISSQYAGGSTEIPFVIHFGSSIGTTTGTNYINAGYYNGTAWRGISSQTLINQNQWNHVALCYNGNTANLFVNGAAVARSYYGSWTSGANQAKILFGKNWNQTLGAAHFYGLMSDIRFVNGIALYPTASPFTPPASPLQVVPNTQLLITGTNPAIVDQTNKFIINTMGSGVTVSNTQSVFGENSVRFSSNSFLQLNCPANNNTFILGEGEFTYESWINVDAITATYQTLFFLNGISGNAALRLDLTPAGTLFLRMYNSAGSSVLAYEFPTTITAGIWYHVAVVRRGVYVSLYVNGILIGSQIVNAVLYNQYTIFIGANSNSSPTGYFTGYMDEMRLLSYAAYTSNFTPPTRPYFDR